MKIILCSIGLVVLLLVDPGWADPEPVTPDTRKARHPASGPTNYNAISVPDGETLSKLQNQVAPQVQIPLKPIGGLPTKTSEIPLTSYGGTSSLPVSHQAPTTATQSLSGGQYYVAMATPHAAGNQVLAPAATPLIMQYINPQGQPTGGLQYIQLLRPVIYPYGATQYVQPSYVTAQHGQQQQLAALSPAHHPHSHSLSPYSHHPAVGPSPTSPPSPASSTTQSSFVPFQPSSLQQYGTVAGVATTASHHPHPHHQPQHHPHLPSPAAYTASVGPVAQYSSPVLSYFPSRISLINGPGDMNLNTNEYMPNPGDHVFIKGVKTIRA